MIQPIWNFKINVCRFKEILLNLCTEISLVSKHHAVMVFPTNIMDTCGSHVIGMYNSAYSADSMEFISIIVHFLQCTISPDGSNIGIVTPHCTASCPGVLACLDRFGVNAEYVLSPTNDNSHILTNLFRESCRQLATNIELFSTNQVRQIILAFFMQTIKKEILTVEPKSLSRYTESDDFEVRAFRNNTMAEYVPEFIYTIFGEILTYSEDSDEICYEVAHKQWIILSSFVTTKLLIFCNLCDFY